MRFVRIEAGAALPFPNQSFDIAYSNAVIGTCGGRCERQAFILSISESPDAFFLACPNRCFQ